MYKRQPPYGTGGAGQRYRGARLGDGLQVEKLSILNDGDTTYRDRLLALYPDTPAYVFGALTMPPPPGTVQTLIYAKRESPYVGGMGARNGWRRNVEAVHMVGPWPVGKPERSSIIQSTQSATGSRHGHPHAKPLDVLCRLLEASPPGLVLDPFAGSGTTLLAADYLQRPWIGIELDPAHHATATANLAQCGLW